MISFAERWYLPIVVACVLASGTAAAQTPEEFARRRLDSGRAFMKSQNFAEALKDFEALLQSYPTSSVADDALLDIATYHLEVARDLAAADSRVKELAKTYPGSDSAAMALVLEGRIALARGRGQEAISTALASFDRVPRLYPGTEAVPAAMYYGGEAARLGGNRAQALERFSQLSTQFPNSPWTARALLESCLSHAKAGQAPRAIEQLQRIRTQFPDSPEARVALDWNTALYRLHLRAPAHSAYAFSGRTITGSAGKLKDVVDIAVDREHNVLVASETSVVSYGSKGNQVAAVPAPEAQAVTFDRFGKLVTVHETGMRSEGRTPVQLVPPTTNNGQPRELKLADAVVTSLGEYLAADRDLKAILKFDADGRYVGDFAKTIEARRLAINDLDEVLALDRGAKTASLFSREGKLLKQIPERGPNYQLRNPTDVAFDALGHIYVLDRSAVLVFTPDASRLLTTFSLQDKTPGAFEEGNALALDAAGRMYIFDGKSDSVKVYR